MSAVTASIIVGSRHRSDPGVQPRWLVLLHEGRSYAWHLLRLPLTSAVVTTTLVDPPGVLWRAGIEQDLMGELALLLHLHTARTPQVLHAVSDCESMRRHRVDLAALEEPEAGAVENAKRIALASGRELMLAATIMAGSRLTEEALLALPDWELSIAHTAVSREWRSYDEGLVVTDYRVPAEETGEEYGEDDLDGVDPWNDAPRVSTEEDEEPTPGGFDPVTESFGRIEAGPGLEAPGDGRREYPLEAGRAEGRRGPESASLHRRRGRWGRRRQRPEPDSEPDAPPLGLADLFDRER